jgi:hypothetical protein
LSDTTARSVRAKWLNIKVVIGSHDPDIREAQREREIAGPLREQ